MSAGLVIVEGAEYASALSAYLEKFHRYKRIPYHGDKPLIQHLDESVWTMGASRVVIERLHLTALHRGKISPSKFGVIDSTFYEFSARLVLAVGKSDGAGILADAYSHSRLNKCTHGEDTPISNLLRWLGLPLGKQDATIRKPTPA